MDGSSGLRADNANAESQGPPPKKRKPKPTAAKGGRDKNLRDVSQIQFPYLDQDTAISVGRAVLDAGGVPLSRDQLAGAMKMVPTSGTFAWKIGTAKMFNVIESKDGKFQLTDLGFALLDSDDTQVKAARVMSFLSVPLYRRVYDEFKGRPLPPRPYGLEQAFVQLGVAPKQKDKARLAFDKSAQQAGFFANGPDRLVEPVIGGSERRIVEPVSEVKGNTTIRGISSVVRPSAALDPLVQGLVDRLPKPGETWEHGKRLRWLQTLAANFDLVYPPDEGDMVIIIESKAI